MEDSFTISSIVVKGMTLNKKKLDEQHLEVKCSLLYQTTGIAQKFQLTV